MAIVHLTEASGGAPRNSGTDGDLVALLDWALVMHGGWTIDQTATNARVYKPAAGTQFRLFVHHDSAVSGDARLAVVRGCESATSAAIAGLTNPYPTVAQVAAGSSNWFISNAASTASRNFDITVGPSFVVFSSNFSGTAGQWETHIFGDAAAAYSAETYNNICFVRNSANTGAAQFWNCASGALAGVGKLFWCRSFDGTVNGSQGALYPIDGAAIGTTPGLPTAQNGPGGLIDLSKCSIADMGSTTTVPSGSKSIACRGWFPNVWMPRHSGSGAVLARDTWGDTPYNAAATFRAVTQLAGGSASWLAVEDTDTWSAPGV